MHEQQQQDQTKVLDTQQEVLDDETKVLDIPIKSGTFIAGDSAFVRVPGRTGKPITVRGTIDTVLDNAVLVELFPEFKLPVRFMYVVALQDVV